jgi:TPR repeat protein
MSAIKYKVGVGLIARFLLSAALLHSFTAAADPQLKERPEARALEQKAESGDKNAINKLGRFYDTQLKDEKKAIYWFTKACGKWDKNCACDIGDDYRSDKDYEKAKYWYEKAYKMGSAQGAFMVAFTLDVDERDGGEYSMEWYEIAHNMGHKQAAYELGYIYDFGANDYPKAAEWYEKSYNIGNIKAARALGMVYEHELKRYDEAVKWYKIAYKHKTIETASPIGDSYFLLGDYSNAIKWLKIAYNEALSIGASYASEIAKDIAQAYETQEDYSKSAKKDYSEAIKWYETAHNTGYRFASYPLARLYDEKLQDYANAIKWYQIAINTYGSKSARENLDALNKKLSQEAPADSNSTAKPQ